MGKLQAPKVLIPIPALVRLVCSLVLHSLCSSNDQFGEIIVNHNPSTSREVSVLKANEGVDPSEHERLELRPYAVVECHRMGIWTRSAA